MSITLEKGEEEKRAVSVPSLILFFLNSIYLEPEVIYQKIHLHPAFKGDPAVN